MFCAQVLVTYGSRVVTAGPTSDPYGQKYKGIWICLELLKRALAGNYVNFGVFELYGDPALKVLSAGYPHYPSIALAEFALNTERVIWTGPSWT